MSLTTDPKDPRLKKWDGEPEPTPVSQNEVYLILSEEERAKGFKRPYRDAYRHVGTAGPRFPLQDITEEQKGWWWKDGKPGPDDYVKFEPYPTDEVERKKYGIAPSSTGRMWSQKDLDRVGRGCGTVTTMGRALSETYARNPHFYGATYCCGCGKHFKVGEDGEFVWVADSERVGT